MGELRQPSTPFGVANATLEDTIIINKNRQESDYHMVTGPTKNILRQSSTNSNITDTQEPHPTRQETIIVLNIINSQTPSVRLHKQPRKGHEKTQNFLSFTRKTSLLSTAN